MKIIFYIFLFIFCVAGFWGGLIACGHDGEKEGIVQYKYNGEDNENQ